MEARWAPGPAFALVAEALGIPTTAIAASTQVGTMTYVLYQPDPDTDEYWTAGLAPDEDDHGIMRIVYQHEAPGFHAQIEARIAATVEKIIEGALGGEAS